MAEDKSRRKSLFSGFGKLVSSKHPSSQSKEKSTEADADLSPSDKDRLFAYQSELSNPRRLGKEAFYHANVAPSEMISARIHSALCSASILSTHESDHQIYNSRISRNLPNQVPWISVHAQRKLIGLLFFWEEELVRWGLIDAQTDAEKAGFETVRAEVQAGTNSAGNSPTSLQGLWEQHRLALARLEASRKQLPSKRDEAGNRLGLSPAMGALPPAYGDTLSTVGVLGSPSREGTPMWALRSAGLDLASIRGGEEASGGLGEPALPMPEKSPAGGR